MSDKTKKFQIYYSDYIEMNGKGIVCIYDNYNQEILNTHKGLENIILYITEVLNLMEFHEYQLALFINGHFSGYELEVDYCHENIINENKLEEIQDFLRTEIEFIELPI